MQRVVNAYSLFTDSVSQGLVDRGFAVLMVRPRLCRGCAAVRGMALRAVV